MIQIKIIYRDLYDFRKSWNDTVNFFVYSQKVEDDNRSNRQRGKKQNKKTVKYKKQQPDREKKMKEVEGSKKDVLYNGIEKRKME